MKVVFFLPAIALLFGCAISKRTNPPIAKARVPSAESSLAKPVRPSAIVSSEEPSEATAKRLVTAGKFYCKTVIARIAEGEKDHPACRTPLSKAAVIYTEICKGEDYLGFSGYSGTESAVLGYHFIENAAQRFSSGMLTCGHPFASVTAVATDMAKSGREAFDGEFKVLIGNGHTESEISKIRATWVTYAQAYVKYLESTAN